MLEGSYGSEPFDLRLTALRLFRNVNKILALTVAGTLVFGGGYYVKNVLLRSEVQYSATSTYKVQYVEEPTQSGDYYINEATWNTMVDTEEFLSAVKEHLVEVAAGTNDVAGNGAANAGTVGSAVDGNGAGAAGAWENDGEDTVLAVTNMTLAELREAISAKLPSDWHIPTTTVVTNDREQTVLLAAAVEAAMVEELAAGAAREIASIRVMDAGTTAEEVPLDVRPVRALILSGILSFFFVITIFLLKELGDDSIWLPSSIRRRYGVPVLGTIKSRELRQNVEYLFGGKENVAVCSVSDEVDTAEVAAALRELDAFEVARADKHTAHASGKAQEGKCTWLPMPAPILFPESCEKLRELPGILLVVKAGSHAGKPLEYVLEFLSQQDCKVTAVLLWDADEVLLRMYYCLPEGRVFQKGDTAHEA